MRTGPTFFPSLLYLPSYISSVTILLSYYSLIVLAVNTDGVFKIGLGARKYK